jgi:hypothetical protein
MAKKEYAKATSPAGEARWPHLKEPEVFEGVEQGYTVKLVLNKEETDALLARIAAEWEKSEESEKVAKGSKVEPYLGGSVNKNGDFEFKFKTKASYKTSNGDIVKRKVPMFDAKGRAGEFNLGNGSTIRVSFQFIPFYKSGKAFGVSLWMEAVQVIKLVEFGGSAGNANAYGFEETDGYDSEQVASFPRSDEEIPF